jgi:ABC-type dipeptide/oligopeptide/nickel transport system permease subunit
MRITDAFLVTPNFLIIMIFIKVMNIVIPRSPLSGIPGIVLLIISFSLGVLNWPAISRVVRGEFMRIRELEFIEAARCLGQSERTIIFRHVFPNALPPVIVVLSMNMAGAILTESALSFLGMGDPSVVSWGWMLSLSQYSMPGGWWEALFPGLSIFFIVLGFNLLGDGLNEAMNPRLRD